MIFSTHTFRNLLRLSRIIFILVRYGFGGLVSELRVIPLFFFVNWLFIFKRKDTDLSVPARIRRILEELGPTFIKLGQVASTRADLIPPEWVEEFKKLQDMVPPFPFEEVRRIVERSLNAPISKKFSSFDAAPIASASIAQVHYAVLINDTPVAVKVRRPNIEKTIDSDISVMYTIAKLLHKHAPASRRFKPVEVVDEFSRVIHNELDMSLEGSNAALFHRLFKDEPLMKIPKVYWDYTTTEVLTMERVEGIPLDEADRIRAMGLDVKKIALDGVTVFFKQVFEYGVFHGDLHPGNIFTTEGGVIIYLDFGIVGRLDKDLRQYLASMLYYLIRQDYHRLAIVHREMGMIGKDVDLHEFEHALRDITEPIFGRTLETIEISTLLMKLIYTARRFKIILQPNLLLLQKSMVIMEGVGRQLYPDINIWEAAKPLIYKWMLKEKFSPKGYIEKGREFTEELASTIFDLPTDFHALLKTTLRDELKVGFVHYGLETLPDKVAIAGRRIAGALIIASLFVGSSIMAVFSPEDALKLFGLPLSGAIGFMLAFLFGMKLWRSVRKEKREE